jgi:hypothetical protein
MFVLPLLFCAHTAKMFSPWHRFLVPSLFPLCTIGVQSRARNTVNSVVSKESSPHVGGKPKPSRSAPITAMAPDSTVLGGFRSLRLYLLSAVYDSET